MTTDPFEHVPALRQRITPAGESGLRVTDAVLAQWDERARAQGRGADWRLSEHAIEASRRGLLAGGAPGDDLWVFGYGSLTWDPGFHFAELRRAALDGHQRRFTYRTTLGRGTPERPALMLSLEARPGRCNGLAFRIAAGRVDEESTLLWRREMLRGGYCPRLLPVDTPQGRVSAVVFTANPAHPDHVGELPLDDSAAIIAGAAGVLGTNRDYLEKLAAQLETLGIDDAYVALLLQRVRALDDAA